MVDRFSQGKRPAIPVQARVWGRFRTRDPPIEGVTITVDGREETMRAVTGVMGNFRLEPAAVGPFFVHIDGRTVGPYDPTQPYYPFVGKKWESVAGQEVSVAPGPTPGKEPRLRGRRSAGSSSTVSGSTARWSSSKAHLRNSIPPGLGKTAP